jgi:cytidylate kinase
MRQADDAVLLETDGLSAEEVVQRLVEMVETCRRPRGST